ncbi:unnamed protein product, partial [Mesorhabditis belari]|uniref:Cystatin domain-containing protein n=1 Tax=Mesorhabditis belari TaxID=2138241 RepID=A0AAF3FFT8_9BILA
MMGGKKEQDHNDPEHFDRAFKAVNAKLNAEGNGEYHLVPIKLLKAESQVVSGVAYHYEALIGESDQKRGDASADSLTKDNTKYRGSGDRAIYKIKVWEQPWKDFVEYNVEKVRDVAHDEHI